MNYNLNKKKEIFFFKTMPEKFAIRKQHILYILKKEIHVYNIKTTKSEKLGTILLSRAKSISFDKRILSIRKNS